MNQILILGTGMINQVVCVVIAEAPVLLSFTTLRLNRTSALTLVYLTMAGTIFLFTGWMRPRLFVSGICSSKTKKSIANAEELDPVSKVVI